MNESTPPLTIENSASQLPTPKGGNWLEGLWRGFSQIWLVTAQVLGSLFMGLVILALVIGLSSSGGEVGLGETHISGSGAAKIAVISLNGTVGAEAGNVWEGGSGISTEIVTSALKQAADDEIVKAVILRINSPGGSAVVSDEIFESIRQFKADYGKPVVASLGDTAASGGYYIAAAADKIVANPSTMTGSIGVIMQTYNASGLLDKVGVKSETIQSGAMKDIGSVSRSMTDSERAVLQSVVDGAYQQFVDRVVEGRGLERSKVLELADGRVYVGSQAKANGLVDELGNLETAVGVAKRLADLQEATVVRYDQSGFWQSLLNSASGLSGLWMMGQVKQLTTTPQTELQYLWSM